MTELFDHKQDVIFTSQSLMAFINKIHKNIRDNYCFVSTSEMAEKLNKNIPLNQDEEEIRQTFLNWSSKYIAKICVINKEFPLKVPTSLRYTWLRGGSLLAFSELLNGFNKDSRPYGTIYIDENNGISTYVVQVKGFKDSNFNNKNASGNNDNNITTNIINADIGNISTINSNIGNFNEINISGNNILDASGKLIINNNDEAYRFSNNLNSYTIATNINDNNFDIYLSDITNIYYLDKISGSYYYLKTPSTNTPYASTTQFYYVGSGTSYYCYKDGSYWGYKQITALSLTDNRFIKRFKNDSIARNYFIKSNNNYIVCNTQNNYNNVTLYIYLGADPAAGYGDDDSSLQLSGSIITYGGIAAQKSIKGYKVHGSVFNDYAEFRHTNAVAPGKCVIETGNGDLIISTQRLQLGANIVSDTYGFSIGETPYANTPIAVCGRVLAYTFENRNLFKPGEAVCSGPDGTISKMTREEIRNWPDAIVGYVSEVPQYDKWGSDQIEVNGRIWIKVK